ncbi:uncharacterized protein LOC111715217 isoform X2 [Eurytemora carolleeae]|uniref:uncharacterized protein LOC111715217 isoform X2 n=1 Tax=Eurytemora carolleeae TaxID=1294199 RepID=UPI000C78624D|nr:uncharacterized protein LOC111715217 isoform X2 [Eurytemora carolleeae]|eukprot:XP_023346298.1 uncharacterized protein LOC111715217 isoform X2 [Eurytemora affinis]
MSCHLLFVSVLYVNLGNLVYNCMAAVTRCLLIRSSTNLANGISYNKTSFAVRCSIYAQFLLIVLVLTCNSPDQGVLYHTCMGEKSFDLAPGLNLIWIIGNFFNVTTVISYLRIFFYLRNMTERNVALKAADKMADRKKNLLPAKIGNPRIHVCTSLMDCSTDCSENWERCRLNKKKMFIN